MVLLGYLLTDQYINVFNIVFMKNIKTVKKNIKYFFSFPIKKFL